MPTARDMLAKKGFSVFFVSPSTSVLEAVERMNRLRVGAVVVIDEGNVHGMFTERDVLMRVIGQQRDPAVTRVREVMTKEVVYCTPEMDADQISGIMKERRIRHVPVCDADGDLLGLISMSDLNAIHASTQASHIEFLNEYVYGRA